MNPANLRITLLSAATFGTGNGVAGWVDREVEHDLDGFPFIRGKTLKGLLAESAENIVFALKLQGRPEWKSVKDSLFGQPGRGLAERGVLHVGDGILPPRICQLVLGERQRHPGAFPPEEVLSSLTGLRKQTAMNPEGGPVHSTLRTMRVVLTGVEFEAKLHYERDLEDREAELLAAAVLDLRHAGTGRNRGRGWLRAELETSNVTRQLFERFAKKVNP